MLKIDRGEFWGSDGPNGEYLFNPQSYVDSPQSINYNVVISAPHLHAHVLELLSDKLQPGNKVLDVGSGTGILCAAFYECMKTDHPYTCVVGIEHIEGLAQSSLRNLNRSYSQQLNYGSIKIVCGDGRQGYAPEAPYDAIHVGAGTQQVPKDLIDQLKVGGKLVIPVGHKDDQYIQVITKKDEQGNIEHHPTLGVRYVDLTSKEKQCP